MKKFVAVFALLAACATTAQAQRGDAEVTIGGQEISINYGRPSLQGRDMLGRLQDGMAWRMGMNEATVLKTSATLVIGGKELSPGDYRLWARKSGDQWEMMISSSMGNFSEASAVAIVPLTKGSTSAVETLTIGLESMGSNKGMFTMAWDTLKVSTEFMVK